MRAAIAISQNGGNKSQKQDLSTHTQPHSQSVERGRCLAPAGAEEHPEHHWSRGGGGALLPLLPHPTRLWGSGKMKQMFPRCRMFVNIPKTIGTLFSYDIHASPCERKADIKYFTKKNAAR